MDDNTIAIDFSEKICIVGAGLVGCMLAVLLGQLGFEVEVYEKRKDPRSDDKTRGRTIAMSISERGWKALRMIGLEDEVRMNTNPKHSRMVHLPDDSFYVQPYGKNGDSINTINRRYLNITLINKALSTGRVKIFFEHQCVDINHETAEATFRDTKTNTIVERSFTRIIAADGNFSSVGTILAERNLIEHKRTALIYGYKELTIPSKVNGDYALANHFVHVWPRQNAILIALPTLQNEFTCTLFLPLEGDGSIDTIQCDKTLLNLFEKNFPDVIPLIPNLDEQFFSNPNSHITAVKALPWNYKDKVLLIGDAAHSIAPFYAMGMNVGFEDCIVFIELLGKNGFSFTKTFEEFGKKRKPDTDALADLSYNNFNSISRSPDPTYNLKWELERRISDLIPDKWIPVYAMIAFSYIPFSKVIKQKEKQDRILNLLVKNYQNISEMPDTELTEIVEKELSGEKTDRVVTMQVAGVNV